ncbi:hypothetical protein FBU59_004720 [Linderina macrospora]|uniref:Uncharacterized protein n=1 Tax=Linderina macrospora TaxID=4868 RepID=A0ACC1J4R7_9FUNG|nr:hypothetical protein FBU59_004720 [Linderina macrospora]
MTADEDFELFGEATADEQAQLSKLQSQRRQERAERVESGDTNDLDFQRMRYRMSRADDGSDSLNGRLPINLGQAFSQPERTEILDAVAAHVAANDWTHGRHSTVPTRDIPVRDLPIGAQLTERLRGLIFPALEKHTQIEQRYWEFRDLFVIGYDANHQRELAVHKDGCLASLTLLLNDPSEFEGGGTLFSDFDLHVKQQPGDAWVHDANLNHAGVAITKGQRIIVVAFMDTVGGMTDVLSTSIPHGFS